MAANKPVSLTWVLADISKNEQRWATASGKITARMSCQWENLSCQVKIRILPSHHQHPKLESVPLFRQFSNKIGGDVNDFGILCYKVYQCLDVLHSQVNW